MWCPLVQRRLARPDWRRQRYAEGSTLGGVGCPSVRVSDPLVFFPGGFMFRIVLLMAMFLSFGLNTQLHAQSQPAAGSTPATPSPGLSDDQKTVYALGLMLQRSLRPFDLSPEELSIVARALADAAAGRPALDLKEWGPKVEPLAAMRRVRVVAREKASGLAYLNTAAAEMGALRTPSGLVYRELASGTGTSPTANDTVRVHYRGMLVDGTVFDSSYDRNEPVAFRLGEVVPCWTEGVQRMKVGGKARLVCPSDLAYGDDGSPGIPGGAALVFEVELVGIIGSPVR